MIDDLRMAVRFARESTSFFSQPYTISECERLLKTQLAHREDSFLRIMARAVFENPRSPYRRLIERARVSYADVTAWVGRNGLESALGELSDAGVYVTLDEFTGRQPIRRDGIDVSVQASDFDNPLLTAHYEGQSGGSRAVGTRTRIDLGLLAHEACSELIALSAIGAAASPMAIWR